MVRCCSGTERDQGRQMSHVWPLCSLIPPKWVQWGHVFSLSSKCFKGEINAEEMMIKSHTLSNYNFRHCFRLANRNMISLSHPSGKETIRGVEERAGTTWKETKRTCYHIQAARLSLPGENSLRLPVGGGLDVSQWITALWRAAIHQDV